MGGRREGPRPSKGGNFEYFVLFMTMSEINVNKMREIMKWYEICETLGLLNYLCDYLLIIFVIN